MRQQLRTYTAYSVGCVIAWAILLPAVAALDSKTSCAPSWCSAGMVDRVDLGHHSQGHIPAARKMAAAADGVAGGLRAVTLPALTTASTAAIAAMLGAVCKTVGLAYVGSNPTPATIKLAGQTRSSGPGLVRCGSGLG